MKQHFLGSFLDPMCTKMTFRYFFKLFFSSRIFGFYAFGALFSVLTAELAKYKIGRLRPYFLTVCKPDLSDENCKDENNYPIFVTNNTCEAEIDVVREARKSFFSGHSSFSFYSATFLILYMHARLKSTSRIKPTKARYICILLSVPYT